MTTKEAKMIKSTAELRSIFWTRRGCCSRCLFSLKDLRTCLQPEWMGMGKAGFYQCRADSPSTTFTLLVLFISTCANTAYCQQQYQCRIQKCTTDFVALTSHLNAALNVFASEFCIALRAYALCTERTAKACRGNLAFHSAMLGINDLMSQRNCSREGPTLIAAKDLVPVSHNMGFCDYENRAGVVRGHRVAAGTELQSTRRYVFCGLFGDPHLRTFRDHFQTCKVEGAWPLIDNDYLSVQVTNVPVVQGSSATATNKITIIFKTYHDCTDQKVYQAMTDDLPAAFIDGTTVGNGWIKTLWIVEKVSGKHVEVHAKYIGMTVIVRQVGPYLTFALRMPEILALSENDNQGLQLCARGCPTNERIDEGGHLPLPTNSPNHLHHPKALPKGAYTLETATAKCHEKIQVKDVYFHSCVFDLLTTGDVNFTAAAYSALQDLETLHPKKDRWHIFPRSSNVAQNINVLFNIYVGLFSFVIIVFL
ncbi:repulsive guidance molecule B isoform X1 [Chiloscyllium punctatum]|uniref:repulsive guidance molecule B isoform X1 n=2 Tax=Chiloscyllium punctatum TaxID=137246 RepID=UPI003B6333DA